MWLTWYYFKDNLLNITNTIEVNTNSWKTVNELITKNYSDKLHHLDLRSQKLSNMPDICEMVAWTRYEYDIWSVDLADNGIEEITEDLSCLKNLQELNLSFNKLKKIDNLEWLSFLKKLDLGNNEIIEIYNLDRLTSLVDLHLGYNKIKNTKWLEKLTNLTSLKLQHNEIDDLSWIKDLLKLEELKMEFNKLDESDLEDISNLKWLKIITVAENAWIKKETIDKLNSFSYKNMLEREKSAWNEGSETKIELKK